MSSATPDNALSAGVATPATVWTRPQQLAIEHGGGDLLVSAAAGSGKTAVLAERCALLVCDANHATGIDNLLVVTFTEAAANEMRGGIAQAIERTLRRQGAEGISDAHAAWLRRQAAMVDRAAISTLHAFCARVLPQHFHEADVDPSFEVMDEDDARLMREEVLETLMAGWHQLPAKAPDAPLDGERFTEFFETYAQGRETCVLRQILAVHRMLATTADPAAYVRDARAAYGAGAAATLAAYSGETLMGRLRLAKLAADRACREVEAVLHTETMHGSLRKARDTIEVAIDNLQRLGVNAWPSIAASMQLEWPRLNSIEEVEDFSGLKDRTWNRMKDVVKALIKPFSRKPGEMLADLHALARPLETLLALTADFQRVFAAAKRAENRLDFNDLERFTLDMLRRPDHAVAMELRRRFHHVLVDEFQDINPLQAAILDGVRNPVAFGGAGNFFRVGDVKQSIYGFRLAEPELFLQQERAAREADARGTALPGGELTGRKPGATADATTDGATARYVALPHNFRSEPQLIGAMNGLFERLLTLEVAGVSYGDGHALQPAPKSPAERDPADAGRAAIEVHLLALEGDEQEADDDDAESRTDRPPPPENASPVEYEARMVADRIAALLAEGRTIRTKHGTLEKIQPKHIAVLLRAMKGRAMIFARAFARRGIAMHAELSTGYFDAPEIADTLALLHVLDNPQQDIPLATVLLGPYGNFSHDDLATVRLTYDRKQVPFATAAARYASDALDADAAEQAGMQGLFGTQAPPFSDDLVARLKAFFEKLALWRSWLHTRPLHEGLAEIYAQSKIFVYVSGLEAGAQRVANLQQLHQRALAFATFRKQGLHRFLRLLERLQDQESVGGGSGDAGEAAVLSEASNVVRLMSIHKSKGLEFPVVVVAGLGSKFNLWNEMPLVHRDLGIGLDVIDLERNVRYDSAATLRIADAQNRARRAEELRLLYVAMTRARNGLLLTGHIAKASKVDDCRAAWRGHAGPLPEDVLLKGISPLDWILPALAGANGPRVDWDDGTAPADAQVSVSLHAPDGTAPTQPQPAKNAGIIANILAAQPLENVPASPEVETLLAQVQSIYPHAAMAQRAAVQSVTYLKTHALIDPDSETPEMADDLAVLAGATMSDADLAAMEDAAALPHDQLNAPAANPADRDNTRIEAARLRGIATHRVLQLLDLADISPPSIERQKQLWVQRKALSAEDLDRADWAGIQWFLEQSNAGKRLLAAATKSPDTLIRREIPFTWLEAPATGSAVDAADLPTLRGVIDVLIANPAARTAEIIDYKTDSAFLWQSRLGDYRRQMRYYLQAAGDILGFPVRHATLVFLSPRHEELMEL